MAYTVTLTTKQNGRFFFCGSFDVLVVSSEIDSIGEFKGTDGKMCFTLQGGILYSRAKSVRNVKLGILTNCSMSSGKRYLPAFSNTSA